MKTVNFFLLILSVLMQIAISIKSFAAHVAFKFDDTHVTIVDKEKVFRFPAKVFQTQFGQKRYGESIDVPGQYSGFLIKMPDKILKTSKVPQKMEKFQKVVDLI